MRICVMFGPPDLPVCQHNLNTFTQICDELGIPLATEKLEGPSISLTFLGIILDTHRMEIRLSKDKLQRIYQELSSWLHKKTTTKWDILSLIGLLQHAIKVVRSEQIFVTRMYSTATKLRELTLFTRLAKSSFVLICFGGTLSLVVGMVWAFSVILTPTSQLTFAFRLMLQVLGGVVHVVIIIGFSCHGLKSGNQWE